MPLRYTRTSAALPAQLSQLAPRTAPWTCRRAFHASPRTLRLESHASTANHYETLNVHPTASPAEIKKSFYHLSKRHHPDHNPSDPHAPTRFMHLSEAYSILSHADKRARYDADVMRRQHPHYHHTPSGSYHSTGPAGGRPASGLSRRRGPSTTFTGPPPSFYRSGGWGAHGAKRRAAHEESTGGSTGWYGTSSNTSRSPPPPPPPGSGPPPPPPNNTGGMGPGQSPHPSRDEEVPHFDRQAHERSAQRRSDDRRAHRSAQKMGVDIDRPESQTNMSFFAVAAILAVVVAVPFALQSVGPGGVSNFSPKEKGEKGEKEKGEKGKEKEKEKERGR